ncbi:MAG: hypothetical protein K2L90_03935, partial [Muribaculaceae bacterium]|nr:hypothetical protein [Muribaculaceae bacterium]
MNHICRSLFTIVITLCNITAYAADAKIIEDIANLRYTADSLHRIGRPDSAIIIGEQAISLAEKSEIPAQIVGTNAAQGVFLRSTGRIEEALKAYSTALDIVTSGVFGESPDDETIEEIASLYINVAVLNLDMAHKDEASTNAIHSANWILRGSDPDLKSQILGVAGSILTGTGDMEHASQYQDMAYRYALEAGNTDAAFRAAAYTMLLTDRMGKPDESDQWRSRCMELLPSIDALMSRLVYYQAECSIALKHDRQGKAIEYFQKILAMDGIESLPFVQLDCYNNMHLSYAAKG